MCIKAVEENPWQLRKVPDKFKTQGMCDKAVRREPYTLDYIPDQFKTQEICNETVRRRPWLLIHVPDWFVTQELIKTWHEHEDDESWDDNGETVEWYEGHQTRKTQKAKIKEELMPITWHPSRWWNWCVPEDKKKKDRKIVGINMSFFVSVDQIQKF